jgi:DNA-3-methyladenine glycosylase I
MSEAAPLRCQWARGSDAMTRYHDEEWGVPQHDDRVLFEFMTLEGAQAGLSWSTILTRRAAYRRAFAGFDIDKVAAYTDADVARLLADPSTGSGQAPSTGSGQAPSTGSGQAPATGSGQAPAIVRNRAKVLSTVANARAAQAVRTQIGSLDAYLWGFVGGQTLRNAFASMHDLPAETEQSRAMSKDLRKRGFGFVGPTICYALMQATGMVNDHAISCFRYGEV